MTPRTGIVAACVTLIGLPGSAWGQVPAGLGGGLGGGLGAAPAGVAVPGGAGALGGVGAVAGVPAAAVAAPRTIWGFFGLSKANLALCKQQICASQAGTMLNSMLMPASAMTGGLIPMCCPTVPTAAQVAALAAAGGPTGAEAVAAQIKRDEADAAARRAAIRYLSTADCHYWPEAEAAIIGGLRDDRNECVRYEAALALLNGCCCTEKTIEALNIVVSGSEKDGKPSETSERVRGVAMAALQGCLLRYRPRAAPVPRESPPPESATAARPTAPLPPSLRRVAYYYVTLRNVPPDLVLAEAERTVARLKSTPAAPTVTQLTGSRSVIGALARAASAPAVPPPARGDVPRQAPAPAAVPPPPIRLNIEPRLAARTVSPTSVPPSPVRLNVEPRPDDPGRVEFSAPPPPFRQLAGKPADDAAPAAPRPTPGPSADRPGRNRVGGTAPAPAAATPARPASASAGRRNLRDVFFDSARFANGH